MTVASLQIAKLEHALTDVIDREQRAHDLHCSAPLLMPCRPLHAALAVYVQFSIESPDAAQRLRTAFSLYKHFPSARKMARVIDLHA